MRCSLYNITGMFTALPLCSWSLHTNSPLVSKEYVLLINVVSLGVVCAMNRIQWCQMLPCHALQAEK